MDYIVNPPVNSCPDSGSSGSGGTSVTSGLTYDGGTLSCLGINYNTNLNTVLSTINSTVCSLQSSVSTNTTNISTNTTNISNLTTTVNNLNSSDFDISGITWSCLSPASASLNDALSAIEAKVCALETSMGSISCPDDGAGSGNVTDYWRPEYAQGFVHDKANKFAYSSLGTGTFTLAEGTTTDPTGCTKVTSGAVHTLPAGSFNKDVYVYNKFSEGIKTYVLNSGDPAPSFVIDEVPLYKFTTDGAANVSFDTDYREYAPYDETIFRSTVDIVSLIGAGTIGQTELDLSSALLYDTVVAISDPKTLVHKSYVDSAIAAIGSGLWTDIGGGSGIYYDASPVGIGTSSPAAGTSAHIDGILRYTDTNQGAGKWLQSDANGNASWQTLNIEFTAEDEGSPLGTFTTFNFVGAGVTATNAGGGVVDVTITGSVSMLDDLSDVSAATPVLYDTLRFDGGNWVNSNVLQASSTSVAIGAPTTIDATLHIKSASGLAFKLETAAGVTAEIDSAGVLDYKKQFKYTYTNGGASPLGAGKVLTSDASGNATWETFTSVSGSGLAGRVARWTSTSVQSYGVLQDNGTTLAFNATPSNLVALGIDATTANEYGISVLNTNGVSATTVFRGVQATVAQANLRNYGVYGSATQATEQNLGVVGQAIKLGSDIVVGTVGVAGTGDAKDALDLCGIPSVGVLGLANNSHWVGILGFVEETSYTGSQQAIVGQINWNASTTKTDAQVFKSQGVNEVSTGAVTNAHHIYLGSHSGNITNKYGIYQSSVDDKNVFFGQTSIGTSSSFANLQVYINTSRDIGIQAKTTSSGAFTYGAIFESGTGGTNRAVEGRSTGGGSTNVGGYFNASGGSANNIGGYFSASGTGANAIQLVDGTEGAGKILTSDASGKASWQVFSGSGISALVDDTTPQLGGTLDANTFNIDMGVNTITDPKVGQWDTAFSWGDHSTAGYALVGSYTNGALTKWNSTTNTLDESILNESTNGIYGNKTYTSVVSSAALSMGATINSVSSGTSRAESIIGITQTTASLGNGSVSGVTALMGGFYTTTSNEVQAFSGYLKATHDVTNASGLHIRSFRVDTGVTVTNLAAIRIGSSDVVGTATNVYGIYQTGTDLNQFGGDVYTQNNLRFDGQIYQENGIYNAGSGVSINFNFDNGNVQKFTMTGNTSVGLPTNVKDGAVYTLCFTQDGTGGRNVTVWHVNFNWGDAGAPDFSTGTSNDKHYVTLIVNGSSYDAIYSGVIH